MPEVTVLTVTHNAGDYLLPAVESIFGQTFGDWELVLVDDGGTDASVGAVEARFGGDGRLRVIRLEENRGMCTGLVRGVAESRGAYVALMDGDDVSLPRRLEAQLAVMRAAPPSLGIVACGARFIDGEGRLLQRRPSLYAPEHIYGDSAFFQPLAHPTFFTRREVFEKAHYRPEFIYAGDVDFLARVAEHFEVVALPLELFHYRTHAGAATRRNRTAQHIYTGATRLMTHRRRAGRPEGFEAALSAAQGLIDTGVEAGDALADYAAGALREGFPALALLQSRLALGFRCTPRRLFLHLRALAAAYAREPRRLRQLAYDLAQRPLVSYLEADGLPRGPHF